MKFFSKMALSIVSFFSLSLSLVSCGDSTPSHIDYSEEAKLLLEYKDKTFVNDGIEEVELKTCIDGDTAHFVDGSGETIKCRFYGIDTPESTGKIEPYGKAASNYTKEKLENASENGTIVISIPQDEYQAPSFDSTGTRYLALIWINETQKESSIEDLKLLNLLLVQNGYSEVKNANEMPRLEPIFRSAWEQAKTEKLNLFSDEEDPLFNYGEYEDTSLLDIKIEIEKTIEKVNNGESYTNAYDGKKVRIVGTVTGYANNILYIQNFYSKENGARKEEGEYAGINVYTGMASIPSKYSKVNTYLQLCGTCIDSENFGFQISGANFKIVPQDDNDAKVLIKAEDNTDEFKLHAFDVEFKDIGLSNLEALYSPVQFSKNVIVTGGYESDSKLGLYFKDEEGNTYDFIIYMAFLYKPYDNKPGTQWRSVENFVNKKFTLSGILSIHKSASSGKYGLQIALRDKSDFALIEE